ncbi:hypothetical protein [Xylophilus ampelinus]|uniref:MFS transporter n=1 Tax=Xylophilus ampelinus TaxID=54067 RepID=A0A318SWE0_9BURK|nr:hypothetical protein [Xylophilus ampelinus]MCS4511125.1 hypothetical protein [Xylophilus ampelinus]PYE75883.1 hypothetical protein DFQ15_1189 [Xylophilus ampelinus]
MHPDAKTLWKAPQWVLAVLLAVLGMLGPFSIDTYIPAFSGISKALGASPVEMQQTLSAYLFGFAFMNLFHGLVANLLFQAHALWAIWPIAFYAFGWALVVPVVTLVVLDLHSERRGMASSLQAVIGSASNGVVAGVLAPLVMHSTVLLATASLCLMGVGLVAWMVVHRAWPEIGRAVAEH